MSAYTHPAYREEKDHLNRTLRVVDAELALAKTEKQSAEAELKYARAFDPDKLPIREILFVKAVQTEKNMARARRKPYFTRINFTERGKGERVYYIGKYGVMDSASLESVVIDWRAPLANLYYSGQLGHVEYTAPDGDVSGELTLKRQFDILDGEILSIFDTDIVSQDAYLQSALNAMNGERLKEIVTTIQAEQNYVIRYPLRQSLIVQGVAGSGKTTIALHRIAYLLYAFRDQLRPENMLILAPNPLFLNYIAGVLPDLGVERVNQTTFSLLMLDLLGKSLGKLALSDRTEAVLSLPAEQREAFAAVARFKGSLTLKRMLADYFQRYEAGFAPTDGIAFGPVKLYSKEELDRFLLVDEAPFPMARRVSEFEKQLKNRVNAAARRLQSWFRDECDRRAALLRKQVADPAEQKARLARLYQSRDERIQQIDDEVKPFLRATLAALPSTEPLALYRAFWEDALASTKDATVRAAAERTLSRMNARQPLEAEDVAPIVYLATRLLPLKRLDMRHVVIDEAQDFNPFEISLLSDLMPAATFTIVGDLMQGIHGWRGLHSWDELNGVVKGACARHELITSYRSTVEIMDTALTVARNRPVAGQTEARAVIRHGEAPVFLPFSNEDEQARQITALIDDWTKAGMRVICVIERYASRAGALAARLPSRLNARVLNTEDTEYTGGVYVAPASAVKGLEFDGVIFADAGEAAYPDDDLNARLLYVGLTRPLHRLALLYSGARTTLLN